MKLITTLFFFGLSCLALATEPSEKVSKFSCKSTDGNFAISGVKTECKDARYKMWEKNGCYDVTVQIGQNETTYEMLRDLEFSQELRQHFYSFFTYNKDEAIMQGFGMEMVGSNGNPPKSRFDTHTSVEAPFTSYFSYCEMQN